MDGKKRNQDNLLLFLEKTQVCFQESVFKKNEKKIYKLYNNNINCEKNLKGSIVLRVSCISTLISYTIEVNKKNLIHFITNSQRGNMNKWYTLE